MRRTRALARVCSVLQPHSAGEEAAARREAVEDRSGPRPAACVEAMPSGINGGGEGAEKAAEPEVRPKPRRATAWQGRPASQKELQNFLFEQKINWWRGPEACRAGHPRGFLTAVTVRCPLPDKRLPATPGSPPATPAGFRQRQGLPATGMCCFPAIQLARSFVVLGCLGVATLVRTGLPGVGPRSGGESSVSGFQPQNRGFLPWRSNAELGPYLGEIGVCSWDRRIRDLRSRGTGRYACWRAKNFSTHPLC